MIKMKNVPLSLSFRCLNSSFYPFVGPIPWLYHTLQRFLLLNILSLLLSSILPADTDLGKNFHLQTFYGTLSNHHFYSLRSKRFRPCGFGAKNEERESKTARKMARVNECGTRSIFRARPNPKIPFLGLSLLRNQTDTFSTQAMISTQIWVVTRHQYGISVLVSQTSFREETSGDVTKC